MLKTTLKAKKITYQISQINYFYGPPRRPDHDYDVEGLIFENSMVRIDNPIGADRWFTDKDEFDGGKGLKLGYKIDRDEIPVDFGYIAYSLLHSFGEYDYNSELASCFLDLIDLADDKDMIRIRPIIWDLVIGDDETSQMRGILFDNRLVMIESRNTSDTWLYSPDDFDAGTFAVSKTSIDESETILIPLTQVAESILKSYDEFGFNSSVNAKVIELFCGAVTERFQSINDLMKE